MRPGSARVAIVISTKLLAHLVSFILDHGTYEQQIVQSIAEAKKVVQEWGPHLAIVDLDSLDGDPLELVALRRQSGVRLPVIGITAKRDMRSKLKAYELGLDDLLTRPFPPEDLIAGALAMMKRVHEMKVEFLPTVRIGSLELDLLDEELRFQGITLKLTPLERAVFYLFAANPGVVITRDELLDLVWGRDFVPESNVVDRHIATLRAKLGQAGAPLLTTVAGHGYELNAPGLIPPGRRPRD